MLGRIFINYRRGDAIAAAGRLHDRLAGVFGRDNLFMDVEHIPAGVDFVGYLEQQVAACDVFLAVIGTSWLDARTEAGVRRLDDPEDFVVVEIAAALARDIRVIPVLIDGAEMPRTEDLPEAIRGLARRNAVNVRNAQFGPDADILIEKISEALKLGPKPVAGRWPILAAGIGGLMIAAIVGAYYAGVPLPWSGAARDVAELKASAEASERARAAREKERLAELAAQIERERQARAKAEATAQRLEQQRAADIKAELERKIAAANAKYDAEVAAREKAEQDARAKASLAEARRKAEYAERQRLAALKAEEDRRQAGEMARRASERNSTESKSAIAISSGTAMSDCVTLGRNIPARFDLRAGMWLCDEERKNFATVARIADRVVVFRENDTVERTCAQGDLCGFNWPVRPLFRIMATADPARGIAPRATMIPR
jgi:hypothetical protein